MANEKRFFLVPETLMAELVMNLSSQPWSKVNGLMTEINACKPYQVTEKPPAPPDPPPTPAQ